MRFSITFVALIGCILLQQGSAKEITVSVMTWNCMQFPTTLSGTGVDPFNWDQEARAARMGDAIRALDPSPDVIGLQEVLNDFALSAIEDLKDLYPYQTEVLGSDCTGVSGVWNRFTGDCPGLDFTQIISSGVMMISKHPFASVNALFFEEHAAFTVDSFAAKGIIYAEIAFNSSYRVHVVNTHLQSDAEIWQDAATADTHAIRMSQLAETKDFLASFDIPDTEPVIIMGDLNVRKDNTANYNEMLEAGGPTVDDLDDPGTGTVSCQSNWASNWFKNKYDDTLVCDAGYVLDYVLLRTDHLQPTTSSQSKVVPMTFSPAIAWGGADPISRDGGEYTDLADHYAVQQTFTFDLQADVLSAAQHASSAPVASFAALLLAAVLSWR